MNFAKFYCKLFLILSAFIVVSQFNCLYAYDGDGFTFDDKGWERDTGVKAAVTLFKINSDCLDEDEIRTPLKPYVYIRKKESSDNVIDAKPENIQEFKDWYKGYAYNRLVVEQKDKRIEILKKMMPNTPGNEIAKMVKEQVDKGSNFGDPVICDFGGYKAFKTTYKIMDFNGINYTIPFGNDVYMVTFNYLGDVELTSKDCFNNFIKTFKITAKISFTTKLFKFLNQPIGYAIIIILGLGIIIVKRVIAG